MRIADMRNLGIQMERWLAEADISNADDLRAIGSAEAWMRLRFMFGPHISIIALHAMEGALLDCDWRKLSLETKSALHVSVSYKAKSHRATKDRDEHPAETAIINTRCESTKMKTILFLCARNKLRSPTAEQIFASLPGFEVSSAGVNSDADNPVTGEMIEEADIIFVMEKTHRRKLQQRFRKYLRNPRVICLDIPDDYAFMDPALVELLRKKVTPHLR